jgi:hypothetical protein
VIEIVTRGGKDVDIYEEESVDDCLGVLLERYLEEEIQAVRIWHRDSRMTAEG